MISESRLLEDISEALHLTETAIELAKQSEWDSALENIQQRDQKLQSLPTEFSDYNSTEQQNIRSRLKDLSQLNTDFLEFSTQSREKVIKQKQEIKRGRHAINQYLNHQ